MMSIYSRIKQKGTEVVLIWIPAHKGIMGNERVDKLAKQALKKEIIDTNIISRAEGRSIVWEKVIKEWQKQWYQESEGRHLYSIKNRVGVVES